MEELKLADFKCQLQEDLTKNKWKKIHMVIEELGVDTTMIIVKKLVAEPFMVGPCEERAGHFVDRFQKAHITPAWADVMKCVKTEQDCEDMAFTLLSEDAAFIQAWYDIPVNSDL